MHGRFCYKNYLGKFTNLIKEPTCFKNPENPTLIDLIDLTNKPLSFKNTYMIEDGLSDFPKMIVAVMKMHFPKMKPQRLLVIGNRRTFTTKLS